MDIERQKERLDEELAFKITENGKEIVCYIISLFENKETGKKYVIYTDGTNDENGMPEILTSTYEIKDGNMELGPITEDSEWDMIDEFLAQVGEEDE